MTLAATIQSGQDHHTRLIDIKIHSGKRSGVINIKGVADPGNLVSRFHTIINTQDTCAVDRACRNGSDVDSSTLFLEA